MNIYQEGFRTDISASIFKLTGKTWLKITGIYAITSIAGYILMFLLGMLFFRNIFFSFFNANTSNPAEITGIIQSLFASLNIMFFVGIALLSLFLLLSMSWVNNFALMLSDSVIKDDNSNFENVFKNSFNKKVFALFGTTLLIYLIFAVGGLLAALTAMIHPAIMILALLIYFILSFKMFLIIPAMVLGNKTVVESFVFSFKHITFIRALKLFGISILVFIVFFLIALVSTLITSVFKEIIVLNMVVSTIINIFLGGIFMALLISSGTGMYFRYAEDIEKDDDFSIDELLVTD